MPAFFRVFCVLIFVTWAPGCGDDNDSDGGGGADCLSRCLAEQDANCTSIKKCNEFCASAPVVSQAGGCDFPGYLSCVQSVDVCQSDAVCSSELNALKSCATVYCLQNQNDPNCATLSSAL